MGAPQQMLLGRGAVLTEISRTDGTTIGDMTANGGLAASFNGSTHQSAGASSALSAASGYVGKDWGAGVTHNISQLYVYSTNGVGGSTGFGDAGATNVSLQFYGSNSLPASATDGTLLYDTGNFTDAANTLKQITSGITAGNYRYHWVRVVRASGASYCSQVRVWEYQ